MAPASGHRAGSVHPVGVGPISDPWQGSHSHHSAGPACRSEAAHGNICRHLQQRRDGAGSWSSLVMTSGALMLLRRHSRVARFQVDRWPSGGPYRRSALPPRGWQDGDVNVPQVVDTPTRLEFFFDPGCPWTWATSRWLVDAAAVRGIEVVWRNLSLGVLNEGRELSEHLRLTLPAGKVAHRLIAALVAADRNDLIGDFYTEYGRRVHHDKVAPSVELVREVAAAAGCGEWLGAVDDEAWDAPVAESTRLAMSLAGPDVGSPIIAFGSPLVGIFGPIVSPPPTDEQGQRLLDVVLLGAQCGGFFEIKRGRSGPVQLGERP